MSIFRSIIAISVLAVTCPLVAAQEASKQVEEDVVIALGQKSEAGLKAMQAFNLGDYETAEIEFERHFDALQRTSRATKRAAQSGSNSSINNQIATGPGTVSGGGGGQAGSAQTAINVSINNAASNAATQSDTLRNSTRKDTKVDYEDFAFAQYMKGLSQIQLGKYTEAKASLRESVKRNYRNYDAQMRLGLLELRDGEVLEARERLIRLDKMRKTCQSKSCEEGPEIKEATLMLARALTDAAAN